MIELEVRCCCDAQKLYGHLQVPRLRPGQRSVTFRWYDRPGFATVVDAFNDVPAPRARTVLLPLAEIVIDGDRYLAIKSDDMPLDELRKIPGFRAAA
jgi:hypothetical protein